MPAEYGWDDGWGDPPVEEPERKPCPGCAEPCNQCDQEALD